MTDKLYAVRLTGISTDETQRLYNREVSKASKVVSNVLAKVPVYDVSEKGMRYIALTENAIGYLYNDVGDKAWYSSNTAKGTPTIGIGHVATDEGFKNNRSAVFMNKYKHFTKQSPMSYKEMWAMFVEDLHKDTPGRGYVTAVRKVTKDFPLNQHQFDALVDVAFNIGIYSIIDAKPDITRGGRLMPELYKKGFLGLVQDGKTDKATIVKFFDNLHIFKNKDSQPGVKCRHKGNKELYFNGIYNITRSKNGQCFIEIPDKDI